MRQLTRNIILLFAIVILRGSDGFSQDVNDSIFKSQILSSLYKGNPVKELPDLSAGNNKPLSLYIFISPECPLCLRYSYLFKSLYKQYADKVQFYGVVPGNAYSPKEVASYKQENKIPFALMIDKGKQLSNYLHATVTPLVILLNRKSEMVYKGAVDNWFVALGKQRPKATEGFLKNAIDQTLRNQTVTVKRTRAIGCSINDL